MAARILNLAVFVRPAFPTPPALPARWGLPVLGMLGAIVCVAGCDEKKPIPEGHERVVIDGRTFVLEPAADEASRVQGLSGRESIPPDGGMIFVFPDAQRRQFVMRDCLVPIDIIFLDAAGRVTATHAMQVEPPRREDEQVEERLKGHPLYDPYERRLRRYGSGGASQFAIELAGGTLDGLAIAVGDRIPLETERLAGMAR